LSISVGGGGWELKVNALTFDRVLAFLIKRRVGSHLLIEVCPRHHQFIVMFLVFLIGYFFMLLYLHSQRFYQLFLIINFVFKLFYQNLSFVYVFSLKSNQLV
jgi:hypothetical protein